MVDLARSGVMGDEWEAAREGTLELLEPPYVHIHVTHKKKRAMPVVPSKKVVDRGLASFPDCGHIKVEAISCLLCL